jgi:uncharacterized membrane protein
MTWAVSLPWWLVACLVLAAGVLAVAGYANAIPPLTARQRALLVGLRLLAFAGVVACLLRPVSVRQAPGSGGRDLVVLVDASRSMRLADGRNGRSRLADAVDLGQNQLLPTLQKERFRAEVLAFGEKVERRPLDRLRADGRLSDLTGALRHVRERTEGRALAGVVVISDGGDTGTPGSAVPAEGPPVYTIGVGGTGAVRDREVVNVTVGDATVEQSVIDLDATVVSRGYGRGPVAVRVFENDRQIHARRVSPSADGAPVTEVFRVSPPRDRPAVYRVEIPADATELTSENNQRSVLVPPAGRRRRVLLVEGTPGFEHSFIKRAWARDPALEIDSVVRKGRNEQGSATYYVQAAGARARALSRGYPASREALFAYDAIVLANVEADMLSSAQFADTAAYVSERGGGLLILGARSFAERGVHATAVGEMLPVDLGGRGPESAGATNVRASRVEVTPVGERHPITQIANSRDASVRLWNELPALAGVASTGQARPGAAVLAQARGAGGETRPLVAVQRYGRGRTMVFAGEASWRWRMMLPSDNQSYATFWRQAGRWLAAQSPDAVTLSASPTAPGLSSEVVVHVQDQAFRPLGDATVQVRITTPSGETRVVRAMPRDATSGSYAVRFDADRAGVFEIEADASRDGRSLGVAREWLLVGGVDPEVADPLRNDAVLQRLAEATGGRRIEASEIAQLPAWLATRASGRVRLVERELWHAPWVLLAIIGCLSTEWMLRRRWGLR